MTNFKLENKDQGNFEVKQCYKSHIIFVIFPEFRVALGHKVFLLKPLSTLFFDENQNVFLKLDIE